MAVNSDAYEKSQSIIKSTPVTIPIDGEASYLVSFAYLIDGNYARGTITVGEYFASGGETYRVIAVLDNGHSGTAKRV